MTVTSQAIANEFIQLAKERGKLLINMQLQKLVFIAQGFSLAIFGAPLHMHNTHTWQWEPVIPKLYKSLQKYGSDFVTASPGATNEIIAGSDQTDILTSLLPLANARRP